MFFKKCWSAVLDFDARVCTIQQYNFNISELLLLNITLLHLESETFHASFKMKCQQHTQLIYMLI